MELLQEKKSRFQFVSRNSWVWILHSSCVALPYVGEASFYHLFHSVKFYLHKSGPEGNCSFIIRYKSYNEHSCIWHSCLHRIILNFNLNSFGPFMTLHYLVLHFVRAGRQRKLVKGKACVSSSNPLPCWKDGGDAHEKQLSLTN